MIGYRNGHLKIDLLYMALAMRKRTFPDNMMVEIGVTKQVTCHSVTHVKWEFNYGPLPANIRFKDENKELFIVGVKKHNIGMYSCRGRDRTDKNYNYFISTATLEIKGTVSCSLNYY